MCFYGWRSTSCRFKFLVVLEEIFTFTLSLLIWFLHFRFILLLVSCFPMNISVYSFSVPVYWTIILIFHGMPWVSNVPMCTTACDIVYRCTFGTGQNPVVRLCHNVQHGKNSLKCAKTLKQCCEMMAIEGSYIGQVTDILGRKTKHVRLVSS